MTPPKWVTNTVTTATSSPIISHQAVEGFQICSFLLLLGCFALVLFLAWPGLIKPGGPLGMVGSVAPGGGGGGIAFTGSLNGGGGVPPRGAANGDYGQMSMSEVGGEGGGGGGAGRPPP